MAYSPDSPRLTWRDKIYMAKRKLFSLGGRFFPYLGLRLNCLRKAGVVVGIDVYIGEDLIISEILEDRQVHLIVGDRVAIAQRVTIITASDPNYSHLSKCFAKVSGRVEIKDDAWVGAGAIILPNVTIGKSAVVAAGAVVTKNVPDFTIVAGVPAKTVKTGEYARKISLLANCE